MSGKKDVVVDLSVYEKAAVKLGINPKKVSDWADAAINGIDNGVLPKEGETVILLDY